MNKNEELSELAGGLVAGGRLLGQFAWDNLRQVAEPDEIEMPEIYMFGMGVIYYWYKNHYDSVDADEAPVLEQMFITIAAGDYNPNSPQIDDEEKRREFESMLFDHFSKGILKYAGLTDAFFGGEPEERQARVYSTSLMILNDICKSTAEWISEMSGAKKSSGFLGRFFKPKTEPKPGRLLAGIQAVGECILKGDGTVRIIVS